MTESKLRMVLVVLLWVANRPVSAIELDQVLAYLGHLMNTDDVSRSLNVLAGCELIKKVVSDGSVYDRFVSTINGGGKSAAQ